MTTMTMTSWAFLNTAHLQHGGVFDVRLMDDDMAARRRSLLPAISVTSPPRQPRRRRLPHRRSTWSPGP